MGEAVSKNAKDVVKVLLDAGADANVSGFFRIIPLLEASKEGYKDIVKLLLKHGADSSVTDSRGRTPLLEASKGGYKGIVELLLDSGADVNESDSSRRTPLLEAAKGGFKDIVKLLLKHGADIEVVEFGEAPLYEATKKGYKDVVKLLLKRGADISVLVKEESGRSPLRKASQKIIVMLVKEAVNKDGKTLLDLAIDKDAFDTYKVLIKHGAKLNRKNVKNIIDNDRVSIYEDFGGNTILHTAIKNKDFDLATYILDRAPYLIGETNSDGLAPFELGVLMYTDDPAFKAFYEKIVSK